METTERSLKTIIEGIHDDNSASMPLKQAKLQFEEKKLGGKLTYDEAVQLAKESEEILAVMNPLDIAYSRFVQTKIQMYRHAALLNDVLCLGRHEHQIKARVLVEFGSQTAEVDVWLNRHEGYYTKDRLNQHVGNHIDGQLRKHGHFSYRGGINRADFVVMNSDELTKYRTQ